MKERARSIASAILNSFERHIFLFNRLTKSAKQRFEQAQWKQVHEAAKARTDYFDLRVEETRALLKNDFAITTLDEKLWRDVKRQYVVFVQNHNQAELAESFYNSVFCHLFDRRYFNNEFIFVEPTLRSSALASQISTRFLLSSNNLEETLLSIIKSFRLETHFIGLTQQVAQLAKSIKARDILPNQSDNIIKLDVVNSLFYRNKAAYLIGRIKQQTADLPFVVPIINNSNTDLKLDALLTTSEDIAIVFGFARAYFFVDCPYPSALVNFLSTLLPLKRTAELYAAIGFHKQGKTQFYRDLLTHLSQSTDQFTIAEGIKGMVMTVFTLPSYPYVFKIIKDTFSPTKTVSRQQVKAQYRRVKLHDRVGRLADTIEYSQVALPIKRFSKSLLQELTAVAENSLSFEDELVVIKHLYIERRMKPLNLYLTNATKRQIDRAMLEYGNAIKQLIAADIFPGDMLLKNFGVTRHGRVVFYDYDEINTMDQVRFRHKPKASTQDQLYAAKPWYTVEPGDVFPEEIAIFALANPKYREPFIKYHAELLECNYWHKIQQQLASGHVADVYPYAATLKLDV